MSIMQRVNGKCFPLLERAIDVRPDMALKNFDFQLKIISLQANKKKEKNGF
jgi:hypothetical protein